MALLCGAGGCGVRSRPGPRAGAASKPRARTEARGAGSSAFQGPRPRSIARGKIGSVTGAPCACDFLGRPPGSGRGELLPAHAPSRRARPCGGERARDVRARCTTRQGSRMGQRARNAGSLRRRVSSIALLDPRKRILAPTRGPCKLGSPKRRASQPAAGFVFAVVQVAPPRSFGLLSPAGAVERALRPTYFLTRYTIDSTLPSKDGPPCPLPGSVVHGPERRTEPRSVDLCRDPARTRSSRRRAYWAWVRAAELSQAACSFRPPHPEIGSGGFFMTFGR